MLGPLVEGVLAVDDQYRLMFANDAAGVMLGFSPVRGEGRVLMELVRSHRLHEAVTTALAEGGSSSELEMGGDEPRVLSVLGSQLPGDPCPGVVLVLHDLSDLRRLEQLRQEFVANVSHELKTPLSAIKAYAETLRGGAMADPDRGAYFFAQIEEQADRLNILILDLLRLARIESGQHSFDITAVPVRPALQRTVSTHLPTAESRGVQIHLDCETPLAVRADEEGFRQIIDNLVDNAVKYTPTGGEVVIRCRSHDGAAVIEVSDTGIGIAPEYLPRLFERFFRVDKARSRDLGGTGLGLSIVKHLAQSFGGSVSVRSEVGQGSTFTVTLDQARAEDLTALAEGTPTP